MVEAEGEGVGEEGAVAGVDGDGEAGPAGPDAGDERGEGDKADAAAAGVFAVGMAEAEAAGGGVGPGEQGEAEGDVGGVFAEAGLGRQGWGRSTAKPTNYTKTAGAEWPTEYTVKSRGAENDSACAGGTGRSRGCR